MGAPTLPRLFLSALGCTTMSSLMFRSLTKTDLSCPLSSKNTSLSPSGVTSSATARVLMCSVLPFSIVTSKWSPTRGPTRKTRVSRRWTGPKVSRKVRNSSHTLGYMAALITSTPLMRGPYCSNSFAFRASRSSGGSVWPGLPSMRTMSFRILLRRGSGNPPYGSPMYPCMNSTTELGKLSSSALSKTSWLVSLFWTMNWARSPTTLDEGVTLMMSPRSWLASR
uniref:Uncharacterized protein n=1 Tax=Ixodes ricinus TaxID=34613 RepID=A0A147BG97_IXORI